MDKKQANRKYISKLFHYTLFAIFLFANTSFAQLSNVDVKIANHGDYTRIAFSFPKLTAYNVQTKNNSIKINLDVNDTLRLPNKSEGIVKGISQSIKKDGLEILVSTSAKFLLKDYRLQRKIIFDIYNDNSKQKQTPETIQKDETKKEEVKNVAPKPTEAKETKSEVKAEAKTVIEDKPKVTADTKDTAPVEKKAEKPENTIAAKNLAEVREKLAKYINVAKEDAKKTEEDNAPDSSSLNRPKDVLTQEEKDLYNEHPTKIAVSRLKPFKLAVFERLGIFWVILDSTEKSDLPLIEGPLKTFIPAPKKLDLPDATAYAYKFPKKLYPIIKRHGLMWEISLYNKDYSKYEPTIVKTIFDKDGKNAKVAISLDTAGEPIKFEDPLVGDSLFVIPVEKADNNVINENTSNDFELYPSILGLVIKPFSDDLKIYSINDFVFITSEKEGLNLQNSVFSVITSKDESNYEDLNYINENRIFNFLEWSKGGVSKLHKNKLDLQDMLLDAKSSEELTAIILELAKLYFANGFGYEASGMLDIAEENNPEVTKNTSFIAIRGAVEALAGRYDRALEYFSYPPIQQNPEIKLWKGLAAAKTEQWTKAEREFPNNNILLLQYPNNISVPFIIYMAESNLRLGKTDAAEDLLNTIKFNSKDVAPHYKIAADYLKGEIANQRGNFKEAIKLWEPVAQGIDRLYHTKATLSLTNLKNKKKMISLDDAINEVESLRFAWRGDRLEVEVLTTLGHLKDQNLKPLEALEDYQQAIKISKSINHDFAYILENMRKIFYDLFMDDVYKDIKPLEAISIYNKFKQLFPEDEVAARIALNFSDYLVKADLLPKAIKLLEEKLDNKTMPYDLIPATGNKLAQIYLMEHKPQKALKSLLETRLDKDLPQSTNEERIFLKARAYSEMGQPNMAVELLKTLNSEKASLMKAEVLWNAKNWAEAATTLQSLLPEKATDLKMENAETILNIAIAYKFAKDDLKLKEIKDKYETFMNTTDKADAFKVITREHNETSLSDKETAMKIADEVTIFKNFFENYKSENK